MLLAAGHDLGAICGGLAVDAAAGTESYKRLDAGEQVLKPGDMYVRDEEGILSGIVYGTDWRTRITPRTESVVFTVYTPAAISRDALEAHPADLESAARLFSSDAVIEMRRVISTG